MRRVPDPTRDRKVPGSWEDRVISGLTGLLLTAASVAVIAIAGAVVVRVVRWLTGW